MRTRDALIVGTVISLLLGAVRPAECQDRKNLLVVQVGAAWPFGETLGLKGWVDGLEFRRQVGARVDATSTCPVR